MAAVGAAADDASCDKRNISRINLQLKLHYMCVASVSWRLLRILVWLLVHSWIVRGPFWL